MPYLKSSVQDLGLPAFLNRMVPLVEWNLATQVSNFDGGERTTGTINPGVIYVADKYQLGVEAIIPVNRASGDGVGVIGQLHLYLDDIFPNSLGKPLFAAASQPWVLTMRNFSSSRAFPELVGFSTAAQAHAMLDHASPAVGSTVASSPGQVTLYFTQALEPKFSGAEVRNAAGARVDHGKSVSGNAMRLSVGSLPPGSLQRDMARAVGRHPHHARELQLPRG